MAINYDALQKKADKQYETRSKPGELKYAARSGKLYAEGHAQTQVKYDGKNTDKMVMHALATSDAFRKKGDFNNAAKALVIAAHNITEYISNEAENPTPEGKDYSAKAAKAYGAVEKRIERVVNQADKKGQLGQIRPWISAMKEARKDYDAERSRPRVTSKPSKLEETTTAATAIGGILGGFLFLSANMTGNVIAGASIKANSIVGATLLVIGFVAGFFWLRSRKK